MQGEKKTQIANNPANNSVGGAAVFGSAPADKKSPILTTSSMPVFKSVSTKTNASHQKAAPIRIQASQTVATANLQASENHETIQSAAAAIPTAQTRKPVTASTPDSASTGIRTMFATDMPDFSKPEPSSSSSETPIASSRVPLASAPTPPPTPSPAPAPRPTSAPMPAIPPAASTPPRVPADMPTFPTAPRPAPQPIPEPTIPAPQPASWTDTTENSDIVLKKEKKPFNKKPLIVAGLSVLLVGIVTMCAIILLPKNANNNAKNPMAIKSSFEKYTTLLDEKFSKYQNIDQKEPVVLLSPEEFARDFSEINDAYINFMNTANNITGQGVISGDYLKLKTYMQIFEHSMDTQNLEAAALAIYNELGADGLKKYIEDTILIVDEDDELRIVTDLQLDYYYAKIAQLAYYSEIGCIDEDGLTVDYICAEATLNGDTKELNSITDQTTRSVSLLYEKNTFAVQSRAIKRIIDKIKLQMENL